MGIHKTQTMSHIIDNKSGEIDLRKHPYLESNLLSSHTNEFLELLTKNRFNVETLNEYDNLLEMSDEDEKYESLINETNMIYKVVSKMDQDINSSSNSDENSDDSDESDINKYSLELLNNNSGSNLLSYNMLDEDSVFIFDFGSELYLWSGRNANNKMKKAGLILAKNLYDNGYDYSNFKLTPLKYQLNFVLKPDNNLKTSIYFKSNMTRPKWTIFGKQVQNAETVLFREKFVDWPNQTNSPSLKKISYVNNKTIETNGNSNNQSLPLTPFRTPLTNRIQPNFLNNNSNSKIAQSPSFHTKEIFNYEPLTVESLKKLINNKHEENPVNLVLENTNLGRGRFWFDEIENRKFQILTEKVTMFKIIENELIECDSQDFGELSSNYTYVIKWHYKVNSVGFRSLKGEASRHNNITGRDRYALFFWQGENSSINEKGASALLSLDFGGSNLATSLAANFNSTEDQQNNDNQVLGEKKSLPHVQIFQHKETAAFCQLFDGSLLIMTKNGNLISDNEWKMFELRGELKEESHLIELKCVSPESLRSKTSFLFLNNQSKILIVWHGCYSSEIHRKLMVECANTIKNR
jgi:supervillin